MSATLEIDLEAIVENWRALAARHSAATAGVIKADAYGLGAAQVAPKLLAAGCEHFFTAHLHEALAVRPLLPGVLLAALNGIESGEAAEFSGQNITPVVGSLHEIALWRAEAARLGRVLPAIVHIDTGMARLGLSAPELAALREDAALLAGLRVDYVMTHLVSADTPESALNPRQAGAFFVAARQFPGAKTSFANSSGLFLGPAFCSDLARPGAALYGLNPTPGRENPMRRVVRLTAPILQIHEVPPGGTVGYGGSWTAARLSRIATLGVGYADGYHRTLSNRATARFDGIPVPLVGRVSMDLTTFDVTDIPAGPGDQLELIGPSHDADALGIEAGTNGYEILTSLGRRYRRRYIGV
ncbi:MAG: alanine racemase [Acidocella sp. 20-63-7]|nr:MAG: alanine racemase [Acidocella sp. 20-63-7]HQT45625.1 alanine racemase [Acidocella sp.]